MLNKPVSDLQLDSPASSSVVSTGEALLTVLAHEHRELLDLSGEGRRVKQKRNLKLGPMLGLLAAGPVLFAASELLKHSFSLSSVFTALKDAVTGDKTDTFGGRDAFMKLFDAPELEQAEIVPSVSPIASPSSYSVSPSAMAGPSSHVEGVLRRVSSNTNVDYATLYAFAGTESNFKADARAGTSSAVGMMQFTDGTWKYLTTKVFPELGYTMGDRYDPEKSATLAALYITQINNTLKQNLNRTPSVGDLYLGYFLGPGGAVKFLKAMQVNPDAPSAALFPSAAAANVNLFYTKAGMPMTLAETYMKITGRINSYYAKATGSQQQTQLAMATPVGKSTPAQSSVAPATENVGKNVPIEVHLPPEQVASASAGTTLPSKSKPKQSYTYTRDRQDRLVVIPT